MKLARTSRTRRSCSARRLAGVTGGGVGVVIVVGVTGAATIDSGRAGVVGVSTAIYLGASTV